jgi:hypothetical protein
MVQNGHVPFGATSNSLNIITIVKTTTKKLKE